MRSLLSTLLSLFNLYLLAHAIPTSSSAPLPLIIWHGLGDRFDNEGIQSVADLARETHPGTATHIISLASTGSDDQRATFFGNLSAQISSVCTNLTSDPQFNGKETRIDALGFSQGGQFLRGLIETCPGINVRSLVTFGSQHNGIAQFSACGTWDLLCKGALAAVKGSAWTEWVQSNVVPAQYYRTIDADTLEPTEEYLNNSAWLADVNNERPQKKDEYKHRLAGLDWFVMYVFGEDQTVIPKESGWFAEVNGTDVVDLRQRRIYDEDWIGLKQLDEKDALVFRTVQGAAHMKLTEEVLTHAFQEFFGPETKTAESILSHSAGKTLGQSADRGWNRAKQWLGQSLLVEDTIDRRCV